MNTAPHTMSEKKVPPVLRDNLSAEAQVIQKTEQFIKPHMETAQTYLEPKVEAARSFAQEKGITLRRVAVWVGIALVGLFLLQNYESASIDFLFWSFQAPKIVILILMIVFGSVLTNWLRGKFKEANRKLLH